MAKAAGMSDIISEEAAPMGDIIVTGDIQLPPQQPKPATGSMGALHKLAMAAAISGGIGTAGYFIGEGLKRESPKTTVQKISEGFLIDLVPGEKK